MNTVQNLPAQNPSVLLKKLTLSSALIVLTLLAAILIFWLSQPQDVHASRGGRASYSGNPVINGGQTCTACHGLGDGAGDGAGDDAAGESDVTLTISGPASVNSGDTNRYTALISGGPAVVGGVGVSVGNVEGTLAAMDTILQLIDGEVTHQLPQAFSNDGTLSFSFEWTAPDYGTTLTMYAAGLSGNNSNDPLGDSVGASSLEITVAGPDATPTSAPPVTPTVAPANSVILETLTSGLNQPVDIQNAGDGRLFIVEQPGHIRVIDANGTLLENDFLDIESQVDNSGNEMGMLGLAFHPNYASNGYFFVNYTMGSPRRTRISRFQVSENANVANAESEAVLLEFGQPNSNHNGGQIQFGPDGYLYIATGDGGGGGDPDRTGQDNSQLLGKLLRIDVDQAGNNAPDCRGAGVSENHYTIPADNPFIDGNSVGANGNCDEIWATGLRNPWRFSFDAVTNDMWIGDVGQNEFEEIDFQSASSSGGENYGWRCYEANEIYRNDAYFQETCGERSQYVFPVYAYGRGSGCSVTGGIVYRGDDYPGLYGQYIFADYCTADLWSLSGDANNNNLAFVELGLENGGSLSSPSTFGVDNRGELYVASRGGSVYQIKTGAPASTPTSTPMPTATPVSTETPIPTDTSTPMGTLVPTGTPEPTPTSGSMVIPSPVAISADYATGAPGSEFTFSAMNLDASVTGKITVNGVEVGTVTSQADGTARFILATDDLESGTYIVRLVIAPETGGTGTGGTVDGINMGGTEIAVAHILITEEAPVRSSEENLQSFQIPPTIGPVTLMLLPVLINPTD